jgi:type 1 fimbriae regulatory protein FimB/type 1 fimbriae regulatory protein FimE
MSPSVLRTVTIDGERVRPTAPGRRSDAEIGRDRKYLTPAEVELLVATAKKRGRYGQRDAVAILVCYRHARASELVTLRWAQIDWATHRLTVQRRKGSISGVAHSILADETRGLKALQREQPAGAQFVFMGERGPVSVAWFQRMLQRVGSEARLPNVHPHQLRHAAGFALADKGRDLREIQLHLGHKAISNTTQYVELRPGRLDRIWE